MQTNEKNWKMNHIVTLNVVTLGKKNEIQYLKVQYVKIGGI